MSKKQEPLRYVGDGTAWVWLGQPPISRDLAADEIEQYGGREAILASGLYEEVNDGDK